MIIIDIFEAITYLFDVYKSQYWKWNIVLECIVNIHYSRVINEGSVCKCWGISFD